MLFRSLISFGILSTKQIRKLHFGEVNRCTALRRLNYLRKGKLIFSCSGLEGGEFVWGLTEKGADHIGGKPILSSINRNMLFHDVTCNEVRIAFEKELLAKNWRSSHFIKSEMARRNLLGGKENIPDWICSIQTPKGHHRTVALELELSLKSQKRFWQTLYSHSQKSFVDTVWYVFPHKRFGEKLFKLGKDFLDKRQKGFLCWSLLSEVTGNLKDAKVHFIDETLSVSQMVGIN